MIINNKNYSIKFKLAELAIERNINENVGDALAETWWMARKALPNFHSTSKDILNLGRMILKYPHNAEGNEDRLFGVQLMTEPTGEIFKFKGKINDILRKK